MPTLEAKRITLTVSDVSGQKVKRVVGVPPDATVGELTKGLEADMRLPRQSSEGAPLTYHARLDREGRHLLPSERVGKALRPGDKIVLQPNVDAGARIFAAAW